MHTEGYYSDKEENTAKEHTSINLSKFLPLLHSDREGEDVNTYV